MAKNIPVKPIVYAAIIVLLLHITGIYPVDLVIYDILSVIASIVDYVVTWIEGVITDAVTGALPGGGS
ncbi:hypothetical protein E2L06_04150 [Haloterrigena sp. H1]|uniref:hypothetical protein n=1 Tax=Haloterrigena sp. H1 TaxID=2552943 RepID=UPI00110D7C2D|nr:hypothetical protein [Haloterrigena sp. H1]TMT85826.1 hypothetical protein E2L06_04150 [Haloterrigena sp. H1]